MSHPLRYVEGSGDFQSLIPRCVHSVFRLSKDPPLKSSMCSLCRTAITRPIEKTKRAEEVSVKAVDADEIELVEEGSEIGQSDLDAVEVTTEADVVTLEDESAVEL